MKRQISILSILGIMLLSLALLAQPGRGNRGGQWADRGPWLDRALDLTEEQQAKMEDLRLQHQKEMIPLQSQIESLRSELHLAMTADKFDKGKVEKIVNDMQKVRTQLQMSRVLHQQAVRELLTPEQRKKFDLHILSRKGPRGGKGFGRGQGMCPNCGMGRGKGPGGPSWGDLDSNPNNE